MRNIGGVVNTAIVMAAARGVITSKNPGLFGEHGSCIEITKAWAKSLLMRMGYVKRKYSNAGKISHILRKSKRNFWQTSRQKS